MGGYKADMGKVITRARAQGFYVEKTFRGHYKFTPHNKKLRVVHAAGTPSDRRGWNNFLADMRRSGYNDREETVVQTTLGQALGDALLDAKNQEPEHKPDRAPARGIPLTSYIKDYLMTRPGATADANDAHPTVATRVPGITVTAVAMAMTGMWRKGGLVRVSEGRRGVYARYRIPTTADETPARVPGTPIPTPPAPAAPAPLAAAEPAPTLAGERTGDPVTDRDLEILDNALVALAQIDEVVHKMRNKMAQLAKLKALLGE